MVSKEKYVESPQKVKNKKKINNYPKSKTSKPEIWHHKNLYKA